MTATTTQKDPSVRPKQVSNQECNWVEINYVHTCLDEREDTGKPVVRLFGVNAAGNSVAAHVHNFTAYFYIHIIENNVTLNPEDIEKFRLKLNRECQARDACVQIDIVDKYPVMYY